jgi:hypothetical protein
VKLSAATAFLAVGVIRVNDVERSVGEEVVVDGSDGSSVVQLVSAL